MKDFLFNIFVGILLIWYVIKYSLCIVLNIQIHNNVLVFTKVAENKDVQYN
jgi:hypothetical protein